MKVTNLEKPGLFRYHGKRLRIRIYILILSLATCLLDVHILSKLNIFPWLRINADYDILGIIISPLIVWSELKFYKRRIRQNKIHYKMNNTKIILFPILTWLPEFSATLWQSKE